MLKTVELVQTDAETALAVLMPDTELAADKTAGDVRGAALARFRANGLPHRRIEEWKYTDLRAAIREVPGLASAGKASGAQVFPGEGYVAVFSNGQFDADASDLPIQDGVSILSLRDALAAEPRLVEQLETPLEGAASPVRDLNTAYARAGIAISVHEDVALDKPLRIVHRFSGNEPGSVFLRHFIDVGEGASLSVEEMFEGLDGTSYHVNTATTLTLAEGATLEHVRVQREGDQAFHLATLEADIGESAELKLVSATFGAALSRVQAAIRFSGEHAKLNHAGLKMLRGQQHGDRTMFVDHAPPNCESEELEKMVLDDTARGVFQGKILVRPDAQKTDGRMMTQALLLSEGSEVDNKPELEIYADDVQCGHGATSGQIDENLLFYLRSRGLPEAQARALLIQAFAGEVIDQISDESLRETVLAHARDWLGA